MSNLVRVEFEQESPLSILRSCTGHAITPYLPGGGQRVVLVVSDEDQAAVERGAATFTVTDLLTGTRHALRRTACGAGCECAIEFDLD